MKSKITLLLSLATLVNFSSFAQCDCSAALSSSLLDISTQYNETQFREFLYQYFKSSKKERKELKRNYSNSFGLSAVVDGLPLEFSSDNNSSKDQKDYFAFEQEILKNNYVSNEIIESIATKTFSNNQLEAYTECLRTKCGHVNNTVTEYGGDPFDVFYVRIVFNNPISTATLELASDVQYSGCTPVYGLTMKRGVVLKTGQDIVQYFKRDNPEKVANVNLDFLDGFSIQPIQLEKKTSNSSIPIGSIIASTLSFSEFHSQSTDKAFNSNESIWAPCDGRAVNGSIYSSRYQKDFVPDLRGQFLRGNFSMGGPSEVIQNTPNGSNPRDGESTQNGYIYQSENFKSHNHSLDSKHNGFYQSGQVRSHGTNGGDSYGFSQSTSSNGGNETRPKNMYVYYYIRIN